MSAALTKLLDREEIDELISEKDLLWLLKIRFIKKITKGILENVVYEYTDDFKEDFQQNINRFEDIQQKLNKKIDLFFRDYIHFFDSIKSNDGNQRFLINYTSNGLIKDLQGKEKKYGKKRILFEMRIGAINENGKEARYLESLIHLHLAKFILIHSFDYEALYSDLEKKRIEEINNEHPGCYFTPSDDDREIVFSMICDIKVLDRGLLNRVLEDRSIGILNKHQEAGKRRHLNTPVDLIKKKVVPKLFNFLKNRSELKKKDNTLNVESMTKAIKKWVEDNSEHSYKSDGLDFSEFESEINDYFIKSESVPGTIVKWVSNLKKDLDI